MNATMGSGQVLLGGSVMKANNNSKGLMRYKSLNSNAKNTTNNVSAVESATKKGSTPSEMSRLTKQFFDFKLQTPKIITIKK